ncbi:MAG TPA: MraY family glycosyltransferase [Candidatus Binatia bacterium]|nr:MraY family glycosyltransferase [Candidatus Binatia bacterium]
MLPSLAAFAVALVAANLLTPVIRDAAHGAGLLDEPDGRKVHETPIPRLGGVAIAAAFYLGITAALVVARTAGSPLGLETGHLPAILVGAALIAAIGVLDDTQGMRARVKFSAQVVVALVAYGLGLSIDRLDGPWGSLALGVWSLPLTVAWIVAVVNALNLIDGLDGLASGVALTALATFFLIASAGGATPPSLIVLAAGAGGAIGFLRYNLHPASIIMGDTGAMLLGYLLAAAAISLTQIGSPAVAPWVPLVALGLPLGDTAWTVVRRLVAGEPVFVADRRHIHHRLLELGLGQRTVALLLWLVSAAFGLLAVSLAV